MRVVETSLNVGTLGRGRWLETAKIFSKTYFIVYLMLFEYQIDVVDIERP